MCVLQAVEGVGLVQHMPTGVSPLMLAALLGSIDCLKLLLRHSQSSSLKGHVDAQGLSVLHYAAWSKVCGTMYYRYKITVLRHVWAFYNVLLILQIIVIYNLLVESLEYDCGI